MTALSLSPSKSFIRYEPIPLLSSSDKKEAYLCVKAVLGTAYPIHECRVTVQSDQGCDEVFAVFCQRGVDLPPNRVLQRIWGNDSPLRGSVLVVKVGCRKPFVSFSSAQSKRLATRAVDVYVRIIVPSASCRLRSNFNSVMVSSYVSSSTSTLPLRDSAR